jgi:transposase
MHQATVFVPEIIPSIFPDDGFEISETAQGRCDHYELQVESRRLRARVGQLEAVHRKGLMREEALKRENEGLRAEIRWLKRQLFGRKTEQKSGLISGDIVGQTNEEVRGRGQQRGAPGHGRKLSDRLPVKEEIADLPAEAKQCPHCGLPYTPFVGTEDAEVVEIEVRPYRRLIRRRRYQPGCTCQGLPGIIAAPAPCRLIPKGKLGISVWVMVLLDKFLYYRPTCRLLSELSGYGLQLAQGTVTGGLNAIAHLFEPVAEAIQAKSKTETRWHADETRYFVFEETEGKAGYRWYLWVFVSPSTIVYVLDPSRSSSVPQAHFQGVPGGILSVDRYVAYKVLLKDGRIRLAFCWAHVRRDFLTVARDWPALKNWAMAWVIAIGLLYHLNRKRLAHQNCPEKYAPAQAQLECKVAEMRQTADEQLADHTLHPAAGKVLDSLIRHWDGLILFVVHPEIPMDNNTAERALRGPVVGRKNFYGAGSSWSGKLAANLFTIFQTLQLNGLNPRTWLTTYLQACAENNNRPPRDITGYLPWNMSKSQLEAFAKPPAWDNSA